MRRSEPAFQGEDFGLPVRPGLLDKRRNVEDSLALASAQQWLIVCNPLQPKVLILDIAPMKWSTIQNDTNNNLGDDSVANRFNSLHNWVTNRADVIHN